MSPAEESRIISCGDMEKDGGPTLTVFLPLTVTERRSFRQARRHRSVDHRPGSQDGDHAAGCIQHRCRTDCRRTVQTACGEDRRAKRSCLARKGRERLQFTRRARRRLAKRIATAVKKRNYEQAKRLVCHPELESFKSRPSHYYAPFPEARLIPSFCIL